MNTELKSPSEPVNLFFRSLSVCLQSEFNIHNVETIVEEKDCPDEFIYSDTSEENVKDIENVVEFDSVHASEEKVNQSKVENCC